MSQILLNTSAYKFYILNKVLAPAERKTYTLNLRIFCPKIGQALYQLSETGVQA